MRLNNRGLTLIELIGALVLLGILVGLITTAVAIFLRTTNQTITDSHIQTEGLLVVRNIENRITTANPNGIKEDECFEGFSLEDNDFERFVLNCLTLIREVRDSSPIELNIRITDEGISIDSSIIEARNLNLISNQSEIVVERTLQNVVVNIKLVFELEEIEDNREFTFRSSNVFRLKD